MLYTLTIESDTRTTVEVYPGYQPVPGSSCMGYEAGTARNCPRYAGYTIQVRGDEYIADSTYCDLHIAEGVVNLLDPEPECCDGGATTNPQTSNPPG